LTQSGDSSSAGNLYESVDAHNNYGRGEHSFAANPVAEMVEDGGAD
jgi:hypothetical protein